MHFTLRHRSAGPCDRTENAERNDATLLPSPATYTMVSITDKGHVHEAGQQ